MDFKDHNYHSLDEWMQVIQECRASGLSDAAWCHQNGIPTSSFYSAVKRCRKKACAIPEQVANPHTEVQEVVPVSFCESVTTPSTNSPLQELDSFAMIQIVVNDYKIQISNNCAKEALKNTLLVLREIC